MMLVSLKRNARMRYGSVLAKEVDCTYSHAVKILQVLQDLGLIEFEKKGRVKLIKLTRKGVDVADAIENCVMYVDNFDPAKSSNPFAYFTQITYYAFLRRIQKEKKQLYVKYKATETAGTLDEFELNENEDGTFRQFELYENISEFISNYENARKAKKAKRAGLEKFVDEDVAK